MQNKHIIRKSGKYPIRYYFHQPLAGSYKRWNIDEMWNRIVAKIFNQQYCKHPSCYSRSNLPKTCPLYHLSNEPTINHINVLVQDKFSILFAMHHWKHSGWHVKFTQLASLHLTKSICKAKHIVSDTIHHKYLSWSGCWLLNRPTMCSSVIWQTIHIWSF